MGANKNTPLIMKLQVFLPAKSSHHRMAATGTFPAIPLPAAAWLFGSGLRLS